MTKKELLFAAALLKMAASEFVNHGCNDLPKNLYAFFTPEEWDNLNQRYHDWNGDPEEYQPGQVKSYDWLWMYWFANELEEMANDV